MITVKYKTVIQLMDKFLPLDVLNYRTFIDNCTKFKDRKNIR